MKTALQSLLAILAIFCQPALAAVGEEGAQYVPPPLVSIVWVWVFLFVFVGICVWFGVALWRAEKRDRAEAQAAAGAQSVASDSQHEAS